MVDGVLDSVFCILDDFLGISNPFFCFASDLFVDALGFLLLVSNYFSGFLLNFASEVFNGALNLILFMMSFLKKCTNFFAS